MKFETYEIVIVGAGPAGMTAALYALRAGKKVLLFEGSAYGGQIIQSRRVENYPGTGEIGGIELAEAMMEQLRALDAEVVFSPVTEVVKEENGFSVVSGEGRCQASAVIFATGVTHRKLGVPGEAEFIGRGVSFCATCDGRFFRGRRVVVVGGGNTAVQDALVLSELCERVFLIHRREGFRAEERLMARLRERENIEVIPNTVVTSIEGGFRPERLELQNVKTGEKRLLEVAGVFEAVGTVPQNAAFAGLVSLDAEGYFETDADCRTEVPGLFAAGDCRRKSVRQLTTATADGTVAALSAIAFLE